MKKIERLYSVDIIKNNGFGEHYDSEIVVAYDAMSACNKVIDILEGNGWNDDQYYILSISPIDIRDIDPEVEE